MCMSANMSFLNKKFLNNKSQKCNGSAGKTALFKNEFQNFAAKIFARTLKMQKRAQGITYTVQDIKNDIFWSRGGKAEQ